MKNKSRIGIVIAVAALLSIPLVAMQFTDEVDWELGDFIIAAVLLLSTGFACEFAIRKVRNTENKIAVCVGILAVLVLIWVELAVGIFGTPFAGS